MRKISIVGTSCSGKTTLGRRLAKQLGYSFLDIDDAYWLPGWVKAGSEVKDTIIQKNAEQEAWVVVGNAYAESKTFIWPNMDTLIWIDVPVYRLLWRGLRRSVFNIYYKRPLCNGNFETISRLFSKESIVVWILKSFRKRRRIYGEFFKNKPYHCEYVHLRTPQDVERFLAGLG